MAITLSSNSNFFTWLETSAQRNASTPIHQGYVAKLALLALEWSNRNQLKVLLGATPEHLNDIGLTRDDLRTALRLPLNQSAAGWISQNIKEKRNGGGDI